MPNKRLGRSGWLKHARRWKKSGLSCAAYSEKHGLNPTSLSWWTWKLRKSGERIPGETRAGRKPRSREKRPATKEAKPVSFFELSPLSAGEVFEGPSSATGLELEVAGVVVRVTSRFDETHLGRVLDVLEARR
jgi:hypothetical protein